MPIHSSMNRPWWKKRYIFTFFLASSNAVFNSSCKSKVFPASRLFNPTSTRNCMESSSLQFSHSSICSINRSSSLQDNSLKINAGIILVACMHCNLSLFFFIFCSAQPAFLFALHIRFRTKRRKARIAVSPFSIRKIHGLIFLPCFIFSSACRSPGPRSEARHVPADGHTNDPSPPELSHNQKLLP